MSKSREEKRDLLHQYLIESEYATENELTLIAKINGWTLESMEQVLYCRSGYRSLKQILGGDYKKFVKNNL